MDKIVTIDKLIIVPNTHLPRIKAKYIISARGIDAREGSQPEFYMAITDTKQVYDHFWNDALSDDDKVPAITHMLYRLQLENGWKFRYIQPKKATDGHADGSKGV